MKHVKIFENFVNSILGQLPDFKFAIDVRNSSEEDIKNAIKEFEKYTDYIKINNFITEIYADLNVLLHGSAYPNYALPIAWIIRVNNEFGYKEIRYSEVFHDLTDADEKYMKDIITLKEFLNVGLAGVKEYIELKNATNKYNL